jgi:hypothetical protein
MENRNLLSGRSYFSTSELFLWASFYPPTTVFGFYFQNTVPWKNGKSQFTKWEELFFRQRVLSAGEFFSANNSIRDFFSVVWKMAENPVGFLPHPIFTLLNM